MARFLFAQNVSIEMLGPMSISAVLKRAGHECDSVIGNAADVLRHVEKTRPHAVGFTCHTGQHHWVNNVARAIKQRFPGITTVMGGPHPTYFPNAVLDPGLDVSCRGEGEYAMLDVCDALEAARPLNDIPNLWVKTNGSLHRNPVRPSISDLEELPWPDRELYYKHRFMRTAPGKRFLAGRGCPYDCSFCFNHALRALYAKKGKTVRWRSPESLVEEICEVRERYDIKTVRFEDDTFTLTPRWLFPFLDLYRHRVGLPFICYAHAETLTEELVKALKAAGCQMVFMGIETGDEEVRQRLLSKRVANRRIHQVNQWLKKHNLRLCSLNIFGLPGEDFEAALETVRFNIALKPDAAWASLYQPYPGTPLADYALRHGFVQQEDLNRVGVNYYRQSVIQHPDIRKIRSLHRLFPLLVRCPRALPAARRLVGLPLDSLLYLLYQLQYAFFLAERNGGLLRSLADGWRLKRLGNI